MLNLTTEEGAAISGAVLLVWAAGWAFRALIQTLRNTDGNQTEEGNSYALFQEPCPACCCCSRCFVAASAANAAAVDVAGVVTDIGAQAAPIGLIGAAVLLIYVGVKAFKWVRAALS